MDRVAIDYRQALSEAAAYLERAAGPRRTEPDLLTACPDGRARWSGFDYPMPALDPAQRQSPGHALRCVQARATSPTTRLRPRRFAS